MISRCALAADAADKARTQNCHPRWQKLTLTPLFASIWRPAVPGAAAASARLLFDHGHRIKPSNLSRPPRRRDLSVIAKKGPGLSGSPGPFQSRLKSPAAAIPAHSHTRVWSHERYTWHPSPLKGTAPELENRKFSPDTTSITLI